ncbi:DEKNAAC102808 [Brettanomyces naardenensis]|uniref:TBP-associated factor 6 n=1 Tax=Brettanomyces naardenensis TaxID=13370 RepID=A0A448YLQ0_BRENA|nr:DEKNAAC102808 [Brettanomyces naardenensis]
MPLERSSAKVPSSHTLWSPYDTVKDVADALGVTNQMNEEVAKNLAMDVEYRIHEILEQALKFMRHGKRKSLTVQDVDRAMKVLNLEPLYGYDVSRPLVFKEAMVGPGQNLYYVDDDEVDFEKLINQPLPKVPRFTSCTAHWLAIEGVQPTIPQNPSPAEIRQLPPTQRGSMYNMLSLNNEDVTLTTNPKTGVTTADQHTESVKKELDVKPLVKHVLSKELQLYFDKAVAALVDDSNDSLKSATLESIRSDPGLHQLVPYFIQFVAETITHNLQNIELLTTMLMVIYSLLTNKSIFLDPYIHALMPCVLTLLLAKKIGLSQGTPEELEQHFKVRELSASLLEKIISEYGSSYNTLKPRVTRTLMRAFLSSTTKNSVGTQVGAIKGMKSLGPEVIRIILAGNLKNWSTLVLGHFDKYDPNRKLLLDKVLECLEVLADDGKLVVKDKQSSEITEEMKQKLTERVGETVAEAILGLDNAAEVYHGIFFGEV